MVSINRSGLLTLTALNAFSVKQRKNVVITQLYWISRMVPGALCKACSVRHTYNWYTARLTGALSRFVRRNPYKLRNGSSTLSKREGRHHGFGCQTVARSQWQWHVYTRAGSGRGSASSNVNEIFARPLLPILCWVLII